VHPVIRNPQLNYSETELQCAIRETLEETGFNPAGFCNEHDFITSFQDQKKVS
jgi:8-oxo-dGTP pyrophosphatase MutT (NUDIX family)